MSKRRVYFADGVIIEATKSNRKRIIEITQKYSDKYVPYRFTKGFTSEEIEQYTNSANCKCGGM